MAWTKSASNPVLPAGAGGTFDQFGVTTPSVLKDGATYRMWYGGTSAGRIGYAASSDGVTWTKFPVAVFFPSGSGWDDLTLSSPSVVKDGETFKMWYTGSGISGPTAIGHATNP